ncbi:MAG: hypothetical protein HWQ43_14115 [Nostoc sp. JL31]|uniref:hypothetical protein n=1 Tax=Nostoc sp. JL31 TaxID=2815395 RepID=UPI0025DD5671|nr:hypothetical protein [Nostoc sp. JL31]MBN3890244.1 hypothetical protein [Nostoc sp. JL31]
MNQNYQAMVGETVTVAIALFEQAPTPASRDAIREHLLLDITSQLPQIVDL